MEKIFTFAELVEAYNDDNASFEEYFCDQFGIELAEFDELKNRFGDKFFVVRPRQDYIRWKGFFDSDFRIFVKNED
jgi:hypothetical protein